MFTEIRNTYAERHKLIFTSLFGSTNQVDEMDMLPQNDIGYEQREIRQVFNVNDPDVLSTERDYFDDAISRDAIEPPAMSQMNQEIPYISLVSGYLGFCFCSRSDRNRVNDNRLAEYFYQLP